MATVVQANRISSEACVEAVYALAERMEALRLALVGGRAAESLSEDLLWAALIAETTDLRNDTRTLARLLDESRLTGQEG